MAGGERKNWRELANAALEAKDPDKLLEIVQELNKVLKHEEQARDFRGLREPLLRQSIRLALPVAQIPKLAS